MDDSVQEATATILPKKTSRTINYKRLRPFQKLAIRAEAESTGQSANEIGRRNGISPATVLSIINDSKLDILSGDQLNRIKRGGAALAYSIAYKAQTHITDEKLDNSSFVQLMVGSKIASEMGDNLTRPSTSLASSRSLLEGISDYQKQLEEKLKDL